ncbi:HAD family hydrolase [Actinoplanes sp. TBRC 11911]|uniref:HAD family hydrolase n=1 Tax=Actinoplanes sp. TBRC 11911 TaxID=2729386 RepID=UPI00145ECD63|nr:HAD family hydrolase [Actinoplanes sp. TBRC 11911]NMO57488.1 HAD family hydrolase [Actinoplanes sp. TBRC 11911]
MLLLVDLDNTLIDRRAAFKRWSDSRYGVAQTPWLIEADRDGYEPREALAQRIAERFGVDLAPVLTDLRAGMVDELQPDPSVTAALRAAAAAGFVPWVLTNGSVAQQEAKLRRTGLDLLVAGWTISEAAGVRKPDPEIFALAQAAAGRPAEWMVGDNPAYDICGGASFGLRTAWVSAGQPWPAGLPCHPDVVAETGAEALREVIRRVDPTGSAVTGTH